MKKILYLTFIFIVMWSLSYAQEFTVLYTEEISFPPIPIADGGSVSPKPVIVYERLNVKDNISYFFDIVTDTCRYSEKEWYEGLLHYVDRNTRQTLKFSHPSSFKKATTYPLIDPKDWKIDSKYYVVNGYNTLRATGMMDGKMVDIYFCPDFPTVFGPFLYSGLPGLVIRVDTPRSRIELVNVHEMDLGPFPNVDFSQIEILDNETYKIENRKFWLGIIRDDKLANNIADDDEKIDSDQVFECVEP